MQSKTFVSHPICTASQDCTRGVTVTNLKATTAQSVITRIMNDTDDWDEWDDNPHWQEMAERLDEIQEEIEEGFGVEFEISVYDAKQLIDVYDRAADGDRSAIMLIMLEFGKLVDMLRLHLEEEGF